MWHPFANKLKRKSNQEATLKQVMIEGILSIQDGASPRILEEKLKIYVPSNSRIVSSNIVGEKVNV